MRSVDEPRKYIQRKDEAGQAEPVTTACKKKLKNINSKHMLPCSFSSLTNPFGPDLTYVKYETMGIVTLSFLVSAEKQAPPKISFEHTGPNKEIFLSPLPTQGVKSDLAPNLHISTKSL